MSIFAAMTICLECQHITIHITIYDLPGRTSTQWHERVLHGAKALHFKQAPLQHFSTGGGRGRRRREAKSQSQGEDYWPAVGRLLHSSALERLFDWLANGEETLLVVHTALLPLYTWQRP